MANSIAVVAFVAEKIFGTDVVKLHQCVVGFNFVDLAAADVEGQVVAFGIRAEVDFGREAPARATERFLILIPPLTPAACWCARMMLELMACSSSAGGPRLAKVSKTASHTPSLLQRLNLRDVRRHIECAHVGDECRRVITLVGPKCQAPYPGRMVHDHRFGRRPFRGTGRLGQGCRDDETAAVFHQRVAHEAELGFLAATLAIEQRLGMRARGMRGVAAIMRLSVFE